MQDEVESSSIGKVKYICPMDPEVEEDQPGSCPICGMALEPDTSTLPDDEDDQESKDSGEKNPELEDMTRRFVVSIIFTIPLFLIAMTHMIPSITIFDSVSHGTLGIIQAVLATPVVLWCGLPFFQRGTKSIINRRLNMFTLIALGTSVAYFYSIIAVVAPQIFPESFRTEEGSVAVYFEAAAVIVTLVLLGQVLELRARSRTSQAIKSLLGLKPKMARRIRDDGSEEDIKLSK